MCLDVLRALGREKGAVELLLGEIGEAAASDRRMAAFAAALKARLATPSLADEAQARAVARDLVLGLQSALLVRHAPPVVADAFCAARLGDDRGGAFGLLPAGVDARAIVARAAPVPS
jgi:putative acyl-CoA dehydrogenase